MKILNPKTKDPNIDSLIETDYIKTMSDEAAVYGDMYLSKDIFIRTMVINTNGVFLFVPVNDFTDCKKISDEIRRYFSITKENSFLFFASKDESFLIDKDDTLINLEDLYVSYDNLYGNLLIPYILRERYGIESSNLQNLISVHEEPEEEAEAPKKTEFVFQGIRFISEDADDEDEDMAPGFVKPIIDTETCRRLCGICDRLEGNERPEDDRCTDEDGTEYVLRYSSKKIAGIDFGISGKKEWFKVSEEDPDKTLLMTVLGGCFGVHKFTEGQIGEGILYLLTGGCIGLMPAIDIIMMMSGTYTYNEVSYYEDGKALKRDSEKVYMRRYTNILYGVLAIVITLMIGFILTNTLYLGVLKTLSSIIAGYGSTMSQDDAGALINNLTSLFGTHFN